MIAKSMTTSARTTVIAHLATTSAAESAADTRDKPRTPGHRQNYSLGGAFGAKLALLVGEHDLHPAILRPPIG